MSENPYIIFEQYVGFDSDDAIPFYKIDNGVIPSPEYGLEEILDNGSTERLRAYCVDEMNLTEFLHIHLEEQIRFFKELMPELTDFRNGRDMYIRYRTLT